MRVLMINANMFETPPCIPIGLEYAVSALQLAGHGVRVLDLWHFEDPLAEIARVLREETFDIAGMTMRNLDTAQAARYINFAPQIRAFTEDLREAGLRVILGGCGFAAMPREIMEYTGADFGVAGPADAALPRLLRELEVNPDAWKRAPLDARIVNGHALGIDPDFVPARAEHIKYFPYIEKGSVVGFATQYGCSESCLYCIEAGTKCVRRSPAAVIAEIKSLCSKGFDHYHLCDSEFNQNLDFCIAFLDELKRAKLNMHWAAYMKPAPCSADLLDGLRDTGVYLITLSVDSAEAGAAGGRYSWDDVAMFVRGCRERGMRLAVDLTVGLPDEPIENVRAAMEFFRRERPELVNVNAFLRVYGGTGLEKLLRERTDLHQYLSDPLPIGPPLERLFFNQIPLPEIKALTCGDPVFKLEGFDHGTNYELLRG